MMLVNIGNSKGIRISKSIIEKYHFGNGIQIIEEKSYIKIVPLKNKLRKNWTEFYIQNSKKIHIDNGFLECGIDDGIE